MKQRIGKILCALGFHRWSKEATIGPLNSVCSFHVHKHDCERDECNIQRVNLQD